MFQCIWSVVNSIIDDPGNPGNWEQDCRGLEYTVSEMGLKIMLVLIHRCSQENES